MYDQYLPQDADEYVACFRMLAAIVSEALDAVEQGHVASTRRLEHIAEAVETLASLRGDSDTFLNILPREVTGPYHKEMYTIEEALRARLIDCGYVYPTPGLA